MVVFGYTDRHPRGFVFGGLPHFPPEFLEVLLFIYLFIVVLCRVVFSFFSFILD